MKNAKDTKCIEEIAEFAIMFPMQVTFITEDQSIALGQIAADDYMVKHPNHANFQPTDFYLNIIFAEESERIRKENSVEGSLQVWKQIDSYLMQFPIYKTKYVTQRMEEWKHALINGGAHRDNFPIS